MQKKILADGVIKSGDVLKVDSFLNHQIDVPFLSELGRQFKRLFANRPVNKILTIEASGIGVACLTAVHMGVPVLFAKKSAGSNMDADVYATEIKSFTHHNVNRVIVSMDLAGQAGATVEGVGICIEKGFQGGGDALRKKGVNLKSLAIIEKMDAGTGTIVFRE